MTTSIYYFTGTGNSLKIAKDIATGLGDANVIPIAKAVNDNSFNITADTIGIVFPVYIWGLPLIVAEFASKLSAGTNSYVFAVANYGGFPAGTLGLLDKALKTRGLKLSSGFGIRMPGNYIPMYGAIPVEKQQKNFSAAQQVIKNIVGTVRARKIVPITVNNFLLNAVFSGFIHPNGSKHIPGSDTKFFADNKCNSCGICEKVCPVANIRILNGKPEWQHHCQQCLACLQWCPVEAIQYGPKTAGRKRYHHPDISVNDIIRQPIGN